jgi:hypothetical protein
MEALLRKYIRSILSEETGRSYHTPNMTPIDLMDQEGLKVTNYYDSTREEWIVIIEELSEKTGKWKEIFEKSFKDTEEAHFWMNQQAELIQRKKFSQDVDFNK